MKKLKITEMVRLSREDYQQSDKLPITLVLDDLRSMHNVGAIFRTADTFRLEQLLLCGITPRPPHADIHKTALGAEETIPWRYFADRAEALSFLRQGGYQLLALEQAHGSRSLETFTPEAGVRYALILGNEVRGVHEEWMQVLDTCLEIPQLGTKHSLNVSVATGIALWQLVPPLLPTLRR